MANVRIRSLKTYSELSECVELQKRTWGPHFDDIVSAALMLVGQKIGGIASGAFDESGALIGIVFGLTGIRNDRRVHWSHMLAVEPKHQGEGLGRRMKLYQRERVRALGVESMYWTFDPLEARNAHFNFNVLHVRFDEYVIDMYGSGESSPLHRGLGTDRFVVRWDLDALHPALTDDMGQLQWEDEEAVVDLPVAKSELGAENAASERSSPATLRADSTTRRLVEIPSNIQALKAANVDDAAAWRTATRAAFSHHLGEDRTVIGFLRHPESGAFVYVLDYA